MKGLPDLSCDVLDRARLSRDARFDGRLFVACSIRRTYCRPTCPVAAANGDAVRYFAWAAEAAEAGFLPCLTCRPEAAPDFPPWLATSAVVRRALQMIQNGTLNQKSIEDLARRLGISARHLCRLFAQNLSASPTIIAQTRRLHFARRLLNETRMPIAKISAASGFTSLRRFNDAFLSSYRVSPSKHRKLVTQTGERNPTEVKLKLAYRPPYDWIHLHSFLSKRAIDGVEVVDGLEYVRSLRTASGHALIRVGRASGEDALDVRIKGAAPSELWPLLAAVQRMFDLTADPARIADALRCDPLLRPLIERRPGLRIPGAPDPFECCVRAILGKGLSVSTGRAVLGSLILKVGPRIDTGVQGVTHQFPGADAIAEANLEELDVSEQRRKTLQQVARAVQDRSINFDESSDEVERALADLPGVGKWAAAYVASRGLGEGDALPYGDLILRREASTREFPLSAQELSARASRWRPFRSYAAFHLWSDAATREAASSEVNREESL